MKKMIKPTTSIFIAGLVAGQAVFANTPPASKAAGENGFQTTIAIEEATRNKYGRGLSDAKKMIEQTRALVRVAAQKEVIDVSGVTELQRAFMQEAAALKKLKGAMETNIEALKILQNSPLDNDMRFLYGCMIATNFIPVWMASNDAKGTPIIRWQRETVRAWMIAMPMILAAYIRAKDPAAAASIGKINEELELELTKLKEVPGATAEFGAEVNKILKITASQVQTAGNNYSMMEEKFKQFVVGQGSEMKIYGTDISVNLPNLIMLGAVLHASLQTTAQVMPGSIGQMAGRANAFLEVAAKNSDQISGIFKNVVNSGKIAAARAATLPGRLNEAMGKTHAGKASKVHLGPDLIGQVMVDGKKDLMIIDGVVADFRIAVDTINGLIKEAEANAKLAK